LAHNANVTLLSAGLATSAAQKVKRGRYKVSAYGTWDGASATLQTSPDNGTTWQTADAGTVFTANGSYGVWIADQLVRVLIANAGTTSITVKLLALDSN